MTESQIQIQLQPKAMGDAEDNINEDTRAKLIVEDVSEKDEKEISKRSAPSQINNDVKKSPSSLQEEVPQGITNERAIQQIIHELNQLCQDRETNFQNHTTKNYKKVKVTIRYVTRPIMLMSLAYLTITAIQIDYNSIFRYQDTDLKAQNIRYQNMQHFVTFFIMVLMLAFDIVLAINRVDYQVFEIDNKIKSLIEKFQPRASTESGDVNSVDQWLHSFKPLQETKEYSFYEDDCFTEAMRGGPGKFQLVPNNTLAEGDIIRLLPGDIAPAFIELIPYDIQTNDGVKIVENEFTNQQKIILNKEKFIIPLSCKPEWQKLQNQDPQKLENEGQPDTPKGLDVDNTLTKQANSAQVQLETDFALKSSKTTMNKQKIKRNASLLLKSKDDSSGTEGQMKKTFQRFKNVDLAQSLGSSKKLLLQSPLKLPRPHFKNLKKDSHNHNSKESMHIDFKGSKISKHMSLIRDDIKGNYKISEQISEDGLNEETLLEKFNREEVNKEFRKNIKKYYIFKVLKTPCIVDLAEYITFNTDLQNEDLSSLADKNKDNLIYYKMKKDFFKILEKVSIVAWLICYLVDLAYFFVLRGNDKANFQLSVSHFVLLCSNFLIPLILNVAEAWSNSVLHTLFDILQISDYNKKMDMQINRTLITSTTGVSGDNFSGLERTQLKQKEKIDKKYQKKEPLHEKSFFSCCLNQRKKSEEYYQLEENNRKAKKQRKENKKIANKVKPDSFYEKTDFKNRDVTMAHNLQKFWKYYRKGIQPNNNLVAQMASLTIFAFIDKEGIVTESQKYIDEMVVISKKGEKQVIDMQHNTFIKREDKIYEFVDNQKFRGNIDTLKALGLAFMFAKNPKQSDTSKELQEMFVLDQIQVEKDKASFVQESILDNTRVRKQIDKESGFQFHNVLAYETETHQDCLCSVARLIGHTEKSYQQYQVLKQLWNIQRNQDIKKDKADAKRDEIINKDVRGLDVFAGRKNQQYNSASESLDKENEIGYDRCSSEVDSADDAENIQNNPLIFVDYKLMKIQERKRQAGFCHILTSIVQDIDSEKYQSFSRGEASVIFNDCADYWDGEKIEHISKSMRTEIKAILAQWNEQYETIGFSYKPITSEFREQVLENFIDKKVKPCISMEQINSELDNSNKEENQAKNKDRLREVQRDQIFLGFVALKHHAKKEVNRIINCFSQAGIRGVLFSKEDILKSKAIAQDLGMDTGWNSWVSLEDDPDEKITNMDGNLVLPFGIEAVRRHIEKIDTIPLQVQIFCKTDQNRTKEMFKIYQENKEVVACLGNIMNSANLKSFMQANVSIGMMIEPSYRCRRCNGRITLEQKNSQDLKNTKLVDHSRINLNEPSILENLSSSLTALACNFVFRANTNVYCIYPGLREARRLLEGIRHLVLMLSVCYSVIFLSYFISEVILGINSQSFPLLTKGQMMAMIFIILPFSSLLCLARPWNLDLLMSRPVLNQRFKDHLDYQRMIVSYSIKHIVFTAVCINAVRLMNLYFTYCLNNPNGSIAFFKQLLWSRYSTEVPILQTQETTFNFTMVLIVLSFIQIGKESPLASIKGSFFAFFVNTQASENENKDEENQNVDTNLTNRNFMWAILVQIGISLLYIAIDIWAKWKYASETEVNDYLSRAIPHYSSWLLLIVSVGLLIMYEEIEKTQIREQFDIDGRMMSIFFTTRLGMWSPR